MLKSKKIQLMLLISFVLLFVVIHVTHPFSKSEVVVSLNCKDKDNLLSSEQVTFDINDMGDGSFYIILPEVINGRTVEKYFIKQTNNIEEDDVYEEFEPEMAYQFTEELTDESIEIQVAYSMQTEDDMMENEEKLATTEQESEIQTYTLLNGFEEGLGTKDDPYQISSKEDLELLANLVNTNEADNVNSGKYTTKYYILTNDIDLEGEAWTPIGLFDTNSATFAFQGNFNGNGHTIKNGTLTITSLPNYKAKYGLFGIISSNSASNRATVCNLEIDSFHINVELAQKLTASSYDLALGILVGQTGKYSSIVNCIVKKSTITVGSNFTLGSTKMLSIGGISGDVALIESTAPQAVEQQNIIENCYSNVDITVNDQNWANNGTSNRYYQYLIGGILGRIRSQEKFPRNCVYTGTIKATKAFIGPIFANARYDANIASTIENYSKTYLGVKDDFTNISNLENCYFYDYKINNGQLHNISENYRSELSSLSIDGIIGYTLGEDYMGKVQGVNRGEYISNVANSIEIFNGYSGIGASYKQWYYDANDEKATFKKEQNSKTNINRSGPLSYIAEVENELPNIVFRWYVDNVLQSETGSSITLPIENFRQSCILKVEAISNGDIIGTKSILAQSETLELIINVNEGENEEIVSAEINTTMGITADDYRFKWYKQDRTTLEFVEISNESSLQITNSVLIGDTLKIVATHKDQALFNMEILYKYDNAIYVNSTNSYINGTNYVIGNDQNNGRTPEKAVRTLEKAYELLAGDKDEKRNIIVIMGNYEGELTSSNVLNKPATITGEYGGINWNATINPLSSFYLNATTIFSNVSFDGNNNANGIFIYCQGNSLVMDENIKLVNFAKAPGNWGLVSTNYPAFCIFGGWLNYKSTYEIPNTPCSITIKSGCYGRVMAGSRNDHPPADTAHYFATLEKPFNAVITIDIQDDTVNKGTYDNSIGLLVGGQSDGSCYINNIINVKNGTIGRLISGNLGYGERSYSDAPADTFFGSTITNLTGGKINEFFGGSYGRGTVKKPTVYFYGKIIMNLTGTEIGNNVYGAGAGGVTGYSDNSTDNFKKWAKDKEMRDINGDTYKLDEAQIVLNIGENAKINGSVYGGGYGYSPGLPTADDIAKDGGCLYGNTTINLTGGTIQGDIYGGGKGTSFYGETRQALARIIGNVTVNVTGNPIIYGNIYGGSEGVDGFDEMGKITGNVLVNVHDVQLGNVQVTDVYGGGKGASANITGNSKIVIENSSVKGSVYGGGDAADIYQNTEVIIKDSIVRTTTYQGQECGGQVYGGGKGNQSVVNGTTSVNIDNSTVEIRVCGGGDAGLVVLGTYVHVFGGSNVVKAVYGGGNSADIGTEENLENEIKANTNVIIEDATIGNLLADGNLKDEIYGAGEVFGGGNYGTVYGDTQATVGSTDVEIATNIASIFYAGGRGRSGDITVKGNSNAYIDGLNTNVTSYGDISLGAVQEDVNITFNGYRNRSATNKYKNMSGINKATNLYLVDSYIYLTGGLKDITNLYVPTNSGIMISENSEILGDFIGGGYLYLQNEVCLTIDNNMYDSDSSNTKTILTLNPQLLDSTYYVIKGNSYSPYIKVKGKDFSSGFGIQSGDGKNYTIYNLKKDDSIADRYNCTAPLENFINTYVTDEYGEIYKNTRNNEDERKYYYDGNVIYLMTNDLEQKDIIDTPVPKANTESIDSIYYIDTTIIIPSFITMDNVSIEDRIYYSDFKKTDNAKIQPNGVFSQNVNIVYSMVKNEEGQFINPDDFEHIRRRIYLESDGVIYQYPVHTCITMVVEGNYYKYIVTENNINKIDLTEFRDEAGNSYIEIENIKAQVEQIDPLVPLLYKKQEEFRFIVDFSNCNTFLVDGLYDLTFEIEDEKEQNENEIFKQVVSNSIQIERRIYSAKLEADRQVYDEGSQPIHITGTLNLNRLTLGNVADTGLDIVVRIKTEDGNGHYIEFPQGVIATINGNEYTNTDHLLVKLIEDLEPRAYNEKIDIIIDRSAVAGNNVAPNGQYTIEFEFYLSNNDVLVGKEPILTKNISFTVERATNYGIKVKSVDKSLNERNDETQIITKKETVIKKVNIEYKKGNLQEGTYILAKTYKRNADGEFVYTDLDATIVENQRVDVNRNQTIQSNLIFGTTLENGTYRIVYELINQSGKKLTSTYIQFIVKR